MDPRLIDQAADELFTEGQLDHAESQPNLRLPGPRSVFDEAMDELWQDERFTLRVADHLARQADPEAEARIANVVDKTGLPEQVVRPNLEHFEKQSRDAEIDLDALLISNPSLARFMTNNPGLVVDDVAALSGLEWAGRSMFAALGFGKDQAEYGVRAYGQLQGYWGSEANEARLAQLEREVLPRYFGDEGWLESAWVEWWKMVPQMIGAAGAGAGTALVVGQMGPQVGLPEELVTAPAAAAFGAWNYTRIQEAGFAYREFKQMRDRDGSPLSPATIYSLSHTTGALNGAFEVIGLGKVAKMAPGGRQLMQRIGATQIKKALKRRGFRDALQQFGRDYAGGILTETGTEMAQEVTPILAGIIGRKVQGGDWDPLDWEQEINNVWEVGLKTFQAMSLGGAFMGGPKLHFDVREANRVRRNMARLEAMTESAKASKLLERSPAKFQEYVRGLKAERGHVRSVYVPVEKWNEIVTAQEGDPQRVALEILGSTKGYDDAMAQGGDGDLVIPIETYLTKVGPAELHEQLKDHIRLFQSDPTWSELAESKAEMDTVLSEAAGRIGDVSQFGPHELEIYRKEYADVLRVTADPVYADGTAQLKALTMATLARRAGLDPVKYYESYDFGLTRAAPLETTFGRAVHRLEAQREGRPLDLVQKRMDGIADGNEKQIAAAASEMAEHVRPGRLLVAAPDGLGNAKANQAIAKAIARTTGAKVVGLEAVKAEIETEQQSRIEKAVGKESTQAKERPEAYAPDNPKTDHKGLAVWLARTGGISLDEESRWRENYPKIPGLASKNGRSFDAIAEELVERWPHAFEDREVARLWLQDDWADGARDTTPVTGRDDQAQAIAAIADEVDRVAEQAEVFGIAIDRGDVGEALAADRGWRQVSAEDVKPGELFLVRDTDQVHKVVRTSEGLVLEDGTDLPLNDFTFYDVLPLGKTRRGGRDVVVIDAVRRSGGRLQQIQSQLPGSRYLAFAQGEPIQQPVPDQLAAQDLDQVFQEQALELFQEVNDEGPVELVQGKKKGPRGPRGKIEFDLKGNRFDITLFENANASTLFHETSHAYFELLADLATGKNAPEDLKQDFRVALSWMSDQTGRKIGSRAQAHKVQAQFTKRGEANKGPLELWARAYEQYLREAKAPSDQLRDLFAKIKTWMLHVYGTIKELVALSPEIRGVFDRMVASRTQIEAMTAQSRLEPIQAVLDTMNEAERVEYQAQARRANEQGETDLANQLAADQAELKEFMGHQRERIEAEVEEEFAGVPAMRALHFLSKGRFFGEDQTRPNLTREDGKSLKLSKRLLLERYGPDALRELPRGPFLYSDDIRRKDSEAIDPDDLAPLVGFESGTALVEALRGAPKYSEAVQEAIERRFESRFGRAIEDPSRIADQALDATHGDQRVEQLLVELRFLRKRLRPQTKAARRSVFEPVAMKAKAREVIDLQTVAELSPHVYQRNVQKRGRLAFEAAEKGDLAKAYSEKELQLWNLMLYRAARDAKKESDATLRMFRRMLKAPAQAQLGRAGEDYRDQVNQLLEQFELKDESGAALRRRKGLREWIAEQLADNSEVIIDDGLLDKGKTHFRELGVGEFRSLKNAVRNIEHLAHLKVTLLREGDRRSFDDARSQLIDALRANIPEQNRYEPDPGKRKPFEGFKKAIREWDARLLRREEIIDRMDGRDSEGPWSEYVWNPIADAQAREGDLTREYTMRLAETFEKLPRERRNRLFTDHVQIDALGKTVSRQTMIVLALNTGNAGNHQRLMEGGMGLVDPRRDSEKWNATIHEILRKLTREDWEFIQGIWDTLESLWPQMEAMERRLTGLAPPKVEPTPATYALEGGSEVQVKGGYYPLVYSRRTPFGRKQLEAAEATQVLFDHRYVRAMTPHGHLQSRVESFTGELAIDLNVIVRHIQQAIHDLTHREAILSIHKLLHDPEIMEAMFDHLGEEEYASFEQWLRRIASDRVVGSDTQFERFLHKTRMNTTVAVMGFKATVSLQNFANYSNVLEKVPAKYFGPALKEMYTDWSETIDFIEGKSGEMRHRFDNLERDIRQAMEDNLGKLGKLSGTKRALHATQRFGFGVIAFTDKFTAYPAWLGAYRNALADGKPEKEAIRHADRIVRTTLSSGAPKDIANIQGGGEAIKAMTMFYSWFSTQYMRFRGLGFDIRTRRGSQDGRVLAGVPWYLARLLSFAIVPAIVAELLSNRGPDDDEGYLEWAATKALFYPALTLPFVRDLAGFVEAWQDNKRRTIRYSPLAGAIEQTGRGLVALIEETGELLEGEDVNEERVAKSASRLMGVTIGLPSSQFEITAGYLWDVLSGEEEPENAAEFSRDVLFRRDKERRR